MNESKYKSYDIFTYNSAEASAQATACTRYQTIIPVFCVTISSFPQAVAQMIIFYLRT